MKYQKKKKDRLIQFSDTIKEKVYFVKVQSKPRIKTSHNSYTASL